MGEVINTNPDPSIYVPIEKYSEHFNKNFESEYLYFVLYYDDGGTHASNFMYWQNVLNGFALYADSNSIDIRYIRGDAYNYYSIGYGGGQFDYETGSDTIGARFVFDRQTNRITLYNSDGTHRWTSPVGLGFATNAYAVEPISTWLMTPEGLVNPEIPDPPAVMSAPFPSQYWRIEEDGLIHALLPGYIPPGEGAFKYAESLAKVTIPDGVKKIGNTAFTYTALKKVSLPEGCVYAESSFPDNCEISIRGEYGQLVGSDGREVLDCYGRRIYVRRNENDG